MISDLWAGMGWDITWYDMTTASVANVTTGRLWDTAHLKVCISDDVGWYLPEQLWLSMHHCHVLVHTTTCTDVFKPKWHNQSDSWLHGLFQYRKKSLVWKIQARTLHGTGVDMWIAWLSSSSCQSFALPVWDRPKLHQKMVWVSTPGRE